MSIKKPHSPGLSFLDTLLTHSLLTFLFVNHHPKEFALAALDFQLMMIDFWGYFILFVPFLSFCWENHHICINFIAVYILSIKIIEDNWLNLEITSSVVKMRKIKQYN